MPKKNKCPYCSGTGWLIRKDVFKWNDAYDEPVYGDERKICFNCVILVPSTYKPNPKYLKSDFFRGKQC